MKVASALEGLMDIQQQILTLFRLVMFHHPGKMLQADPLRTLQDKICNFVRINRQQIKKGYNSTKVLAGI